MTLMHPASRILCISAWLGLLSSFGVANEFRSIAVVRPFCPLDAHKLSSSFEIWDSLPPTVKGSNVVVDLVVAYSQSLDGDSFVATTAIDESRSKFEATSGWDHSFNGFVSFGVDIAPEDDIYIPTERDTSSDWVNGPNRQFERMLRHLEGMYDLVYIMEIDSVPIKPYWLDTLTSDIASNEDEFTILGSKYRGYKWDSFVDELPWALVNHINGNGVYNLTHPLLWDFVDRLEVEATSVANAVPYDYRIAQMIHEVQTGDVPTVLGESESLKLPQATVSALARFDLNKLIRETAVIGNYATTDMVPEYFGENEAIIHGASMRMLWDSEKVGSLSAVIRVWEDDFDVKEFGSMLDSLSPQVSEVILVVPAKASPQTLNLILDLASIKTNVRLFAFQGAGNGAHASDICAATVNTPWFIVSDSYHHMSSERLDLMTTTEGDPLRPVVNYQESSFESCFKFPSCVKELDLAKHLDPNFQKLFLTSDFVFHTQSWKNFCDALPTLVSREDNFMMQYAGASSFMSFLEGKGKVETLYELSDRALYGSHEQFVPTLDDETEFAVPSTTERSLLILASLSNSTNTKAPKAAKAKRSKAPKAFGTKRERF